MRLMIVPCAAAVLALYVTIGTSERALAFGDQTRGSSGFQGQFGEQQGSVGEQRSTRTYRKRSAPPPVAAAVRRQPPEAVPGNSREALYMRCRNAVFQAYGREYVYPDGRRARSLPSSWSVGQIDACVMNGGKAI